MLSVSLQRCNKKSCGLSSWTAMALSPPVSSGNRWISISKYRLYSGLPTNNQGGVCARWPTTHQGRESRGGEFAVLPERRKLRGAVSALIESASQHPNPTGWNLQHSSKASNAFMGQEQQCRKRICSVLRGPRLESLFCWLSASSSQMQN